MTAENLFDMLKAQEWLTALEFRKWTFYTTDMWEGNSGEHHSCGHIFPVTSDQKERVEVYERVENLAYKREITLPVNQSPMALKEALIKCTELRQRIKAQFGEKALTKYCFNQKIVWKGKVAS